MAGKKQVKADTSILVNVVLDKSGSMESCRDATISGFNEFKGDQQREGKMLKSKTLVSLTLFDTTYEMRHIAVPVEDVPDLTRATYVPGGMTALYDAVGASIRAVEATKDLPAKVLFVIQTDGAENSSREWDRARIFKLIEDKRKEGWAFLFMGADQDAYAASAGMGIAAGSTVSYASANTSAIYGAVSRSAALYRTGKRTADNLTTVPGDHEPTPR